MSLRTEHFDNHGRRRQLAAHLPRPKGFQLDEVSPLRRKVYRRLLAAQLIALVGTGVTTVALGLLAYDIAGASAGAVLGGALALKMVAYVGLAPVIAAFAHRFERRRFLVSLDLIRAVVLGVLPFVSEVWQVFVLIFVVNACAAGFTPAYQATLPEVLPDEREYTRALSFSRLSYDLGELLSPAIAALLLLVFSFQVLFAINAAAFVASGLLIWSAGLQGLGRSPVSERTWRRITVGVRKYLLIPRLRGLFALNLAVACASAMTIVNTVVLTRDEFGLSSSAVAVALGAAGLGAAVTALLLPRLLDRVDQRSVMLAGASLLAAGLPLVAVLPAYWTLLILWLLLGVGLSTVQTPAGLLIQRSADDDTRPALFAAQFSLSHLCWLLTYPISGVAGAALGIGTVSISLGVVAAIATVTASVLWRPESG